MVVWTSKSSLLNSCRNIDRTLPASIFSSMASPMSPDLAFESRRLLVHVEKRPLYLSSAFSQCLARAMLSEKTAFSPRPFS